MYTEIPYCMDSIFILTHAYYYYCLLFTYQIFQAPFPNTGKRIMGKYNQSCIICICIKLHLIKKMYNITKIIDVAILKYL